MSASSVDTLVMIVRAALGLGDTLEQPGNVNWKEVFDLANRQGVAALTSDGLQVLYENKPELLSTLDAPQNKQMKYDLFGSALSYELNYEQHGEFIRELADLFAQDGIRTMVFKGRGLALYYPAPNHRASGDIDLYLFHKGANADRMVKERYGVSIKQNEDKHSVYKIHDVLVENHVSFVNIQEYPHLAGLEQFLEGAALNCPHEDLGGVDMYYPTVMMYAAFLPYHTAGHFMYGGLSMKQFVDWAVITSRYGDEIDWDIVYELAESAGFLRFLNALNGIVIDRFGVPADMFPSWDRDLKLESRVWDELLLTCDTDNTPSSLLSRALRFLSSKWKFELIYRENYYVTFIKRSWASLRGRYIRGSRSVWKQDEQNDEKV